MLGLAALVLATASANASPLLTSASSWWEKITYTIAGDGAQQSCRYESSIAGTQSCDSADSTAPLESKGSTGIYTKITIERRFTPDQPNLDGLKPGDTLLGGKVMALEIDGTGAVRGCQIVGASGDLRPAYGCSEARAERFEASARQATPVRQGFMTILVYGHEEYLA